MNANKNFSILFFILKRLNIINITERNINPIAAYDIHIFKRPGDTTITPFIFADNYTILKRFCDSDDPFEMLQLVEPHMTKVTCVLGVVMKY